MRRHPRKENTYEADPRHAEIISHETGAETLKTIPTLAARETERETGGEETRFERAQVERQILNDDDADTLSSDEVTRYRRTAARGSFLAQERMDIPLAAMEATWRAHQRRLAQTRPAGRDSVRYSRVVNWYKHQHESEQVVAACSDSDRPGCRRTERSTSGGCIHRGQHAAVLEKDRPRWR